MSKRKDSQGKIIAERIFQHPTQEGAVETIRIGLEEPVQVPISPDRPAEPSFRRI